MVVVVVVTMRIDGRLLYPDSISVVVVVAVTPPNRSYSDAKRVTMQHKGGLESYFICTSSSSSSTTLLVNQPSHDSDIGNGMAYRYLAPMQAHAPSSVLKDKK